MSTKTDQQLKGWALATLADVTEHHSGNSKLIKGRLSNHAGDGLFPAFSATGQDVWRDNFEEEGDAIIVSAVGARCGKCFLASGKWSAIANTHVVRPRDHAINTRFLWYRLNNEHFWIRSGAAQPFVVVTKTLEREFHLPPLSEQERIVVKIDELLSELDNGIKELGEGQVELKRYRSSVLAAACSGKLVPTEAELAQSEGRNYETGPELLARILKERREKWTGRGKYKEPAAPDTTNLPALPEGWTWASLEQMSLSSSYGTSVKCNFTNSGVPVLRIPNIQSGRIDLDDLKFADAKIIIAKGDELMPGDLLIIRTNGSKNLIGRSAVIKEKMSRKMTYASYLIRFRLALGSPFSNWLSAVWNVSFLRQWIEAHASTSAGQHNISMSKLATMPVPVPSLIEQERITTEIERRLSIADEIEQVLSANLQRAEHLRQSILQQAFTGKLVPQDESDESAIALLERISAKRVDVAPRKKVTSKTRVRIKAAAK